MVWVHLRTADEGVFGIGQTRGGAVTAGLIEAHLSGLLVGRPAGSIAERTAELTSAVLPYAQGGIAAMAVSALELALWDLTSRSAGVPLVDVLGGRGEIPPRYYLTLPSVDLLQEVDDAVISQAATVKLAASHGPADGRAGMDTMLAQLQNLRAHVPEHVPLSVDCFMSWDLDYTTDFVRRADHLHLGWIEEPLAPRDFAGYAELRAAIRPTAVAGGEHLFGLADATEFVRQRCGSVLQLDVTWCGGLSVAATAGRLAVEEGMTFAPHAAGLQPWATHLLHAFGPHTLQEIVLGVGTTEIPAVPHDRPGVGVTPQDAGFG